MRWLLLLFLTCLGCEGGSESNKATDSVPDSVRETGSTDSDTGETADSGAEDSVETGGQESGDSGDAAEYTKILGDYGYGGCGPGCIGLASGDIDADGDAEVGVGLGHAYPQNGADADGAVFFVEDPGSGSRQLPDGAEGEVVGLGGDYFGDGGLDVQGDVNGDGVADILVGQTLAPGTGSSYPGRAYLFYGPLTADRTSADADAWFTVDCPGYDGYTYHYCELGYQLSTGDINGDGYSDVVLNGGAWDYTFTDEYEFPYDGAVFYGPLYGEQTMESDAGARFSTHRGFEAVGDLDGDGLCDVVGNDDTDANHYASIFSGPLLGDLASEDASAWWSVSEAGYTNSFGGPAHDLNGDGYLDVVVADSSLDTGGNHSGSVFVTYGPYAGAMDLVGTSAELTGAENEYAGSAVVTLDDLDGDGRAELVVGAPANGVEHGPGTIYIVPGPVTGSGPIADVASHVLAYGDGEDMFGDTLGAGGDVDGDGIPDLLASGPGDEDGGAYAGAVWVIYGKFLQ